jgi:hypothetical protein
VATAALGYNRFSGIDCRFDILWVVFLSMLLHSSHDM